MKLSALLLSSTLALFAGTTALPQPEPMPGLAEPKEALAPASVTGTVNANYIKYRRCPYTSCEPVGQYNKGKVITIVCMTPGTPVEGYEWWDKMSNGYYISDYYVDWNGSAPSEC
ncbi:hypothetical protein NMY22_g4894 [Coprinellus aureogranulatus]|nr:hypothetical protein NMY22_g4894 [Coprinellus aureogranulatus]